MQRVELYRFPTSGPEDVSGLARDAAALEEQREKVVRDSQVAVDRARREIDVRPEALLPAYRVLCRLGDREPVRLAALG